MKKITDSSLRNLKATGKSYEIYVGEGFLIRVGQTGDVRFYYRYRSGKRKLTIKLGTYPGTSLARARKKHASLADQRKNGQLLDTEAKGGEAVKDLAKTYIRHHAQPHKRTWEEDQRILDKDVLPVIGHKKARDVRKRDIVLVLDAVAKRGNRQANYTRSVLHKMFNVGLERDFGGIEFNPVAGTAKRAENPPKKRWLSETEIRAFWHGFAKTNIHENTLRVLKLILVTGQRPSECLGILQDEIDGDWWTIPGKRTKNDQDQRVYLTDLAKKLIGKDDPPFPSPANQEALGHALRRIFDPKRKRNKPAILKFTPHDLRRTMTTHLAQRKVKKHLLQRILNHSDGSVTDIYNQYEYDDEAQEAWQLWEQSLLEILAASDTEE